MHFPVAGAGQEDAVNKIPYKLQVKIGQSEFSAEGPEEAVRQAYADFLAANAQVKTAALTPHTAAGVPTLAVSTSTATPPEDAATLDRYFKREGDIISLRHLPATPNRTADAAIVLIYGYMKMAGMEDVPVTKLNEGLRRSGLNLTRLDRELGVNHSLFRKGGQRSGGRYTLNNQGLKQAEDWLTEWA